MRTEPCRIDVRMVSFGRTSGEWLCNGGVGGGEIVFTSAMAASPLYAIALAVYALIRHKQYACFLRI